MSWSVSMTNEGYANCADQLQAATREFLTVAWAECRAAKSAGPGREPDFVPTRYKKALAQARRLPSDVLADALYEDLEAINTSDNGGFAVWVCPWGCHTVPPDPVDTD